MPFGQPLEPERVLGEDRERAERFNAFRDDGLGYLHIQATRPQTLAYSLTDSPSGCWPGSSRSFPRVDRP